MRKRKASLKYSLLTALMVASLTAPAQAVLADTQTVGNRTIFEEAAPSGSAENLLTDATNTPESGMPNDIIPGSEYDTPGSIATGSENGTPADFATGTENGAQADSLDAADDFVSEDDLNVGNFADDADAPNTEDPANGEDTLNTGSTIYVSSTGSDSRDGRTESTAVKSFEKALALAGNGDTIVLLNSIVTEQLSNDLPLVIAKKVTITGGSLTVNHAGIILGNNVTFTDMNLKFANMVRNAIIANGNTLTLRNVSNPAIGKNSLHLFAGTLTEPMDGVTVPSPGGEGRIELSGKVQVGEIHAGALSDVSNDTFTDVVSTNVSDVPAKITLKSDLSGESTIGTIYGCGAREVRGYTGGGQSGGDALVSAPTLYRVTGSAIVQVETANAIGNIDLDGNTGSDLNARVYYTSTSSYLRGFRNVANLASLDVYSGQYNLKSNRADTLANTDISVNGGALLSFTDILSPLTIRNFDGGSPENPAHLLFFGKMGEMNKQKLTIQGEVSGFTNVSINYTSFPDKAELDYAYISTPNSLNGEFHLIPASSQAGKDFYRNSNGDWIIPSKPISTDTDLSRATITLPNYTGSVPYDPEMVYFESDDVEVRLNGALVPSDCYLFSAYYYEIGEDGGELYIFGNKDKGYSGGTSIFFNIDPLQVTDEALTKASASVCPTGGVITIDLPVLPDPLEMFYKYPIIQGYDTPVSDADIKTTAPGKTVATITVGAITPGTTYTVDFPVDVYDNYKDDCPYAPYTLTLTVGTRDHEYGEPIEIQAPTCTKPGKAEKTCRFCSHKETVDIPKIAHTYGDWTLVKPATLSAYGQQKRTCVCGAAVTQSIPRIAAVTLNGTRFTYTGNSIRPTISVKDMIGQTLVNGRDYKVTYPANAATAGQKTATVAFIGNYSGTRSLTYVVLPKVPTAAAANLSTYHDVTFTWSASAGATGYDVYMKKTADSAYTLLGSTAETRFVKNGLADGTQYSFKVVPYITAGSVKYTATGSKIATVYTLKKMALPKITAAGSQVTITWTNQPGAGGYQISKSSVKTGTAVAATVPASSTGRTAIAMPRNQAAYFKIRSYRIVNGKYIYGPWSNAIFFRNN